MNIEKKAYQLAIIKATVIKTIDEDFNLKVNTGNISKEEANKIGKLFKRKAEAYLDKTPTDKLSPKEFENQKEFRDHILKIIKEIRKEVLKQE